MSTVSLVDPFRFGAGPITVPGERPAFALSGAAYEHTSLTTTHTPAYPATVNAGDMALVVMWGQSTSINTTLSLHANATAAGWVAISGTLRSAAGTEAVLVARRICAGTEDGAAMEGGITGSGNETSSHVHGVIFTVSAADGFHGTTPLEDIKTAEETGTTMNGPTVAPSGVRRLAMSIIGFDGDSMGADAFVGANATWTERIDIETALQTDSSIQVQTAPADAEVSGGSDTLLLDVKRLRFSFAIAPADVAA